ncbi:MAG: DUF2341 domain-containing protein, partial [Chitinivibrionales bacterium]|nr:DUF2341 domain-containing protein [Chitinivibrionales bacterium]
SPTTEYAFQIKSRNSAAGCSGTESDLSPAASAPEDYSSWTYWKYIEIDGTCAGITDTLTDFPLLVRLTGSNFDFSQDYSDGDDIRFTNEDGSIHFDYEVENWNETADEAEIWVKVDSVYGNNTTKVRMYWGMSGATSNSCDSCVFDTANGFVGVWHMEESATDIVDATSNRNTGTIVSAPTQAGGTVSKSIYFDGSDDKFNVGNLGLADGTHDEITISTWLKTDAGIGNYAKMIAHGGTYTYPYALQRGTSDQIKTEIDDVSSAYLSHTAGWHYAAGRYDSDATESEEILIQVDTDTASTNNAGGNINQDATNDDTYIGARSDNAQNWKGWLDEVRIEKVARSLDWLALCYQTQKASPSCISEDSRTLNLASVADGDASAINNQTDVYLGYAQFTLSGNGSDPFLQSVTITAVDAPAISEADNLSSIRAYYNTSTTPSTTNQYGSTTTFSGNSSGTASFSESMQVTATTYVHFYCNVGEDIENAGNLRLQVSFTSSNEGTGDPTTNSTGTTFYQIADTVNYLPLTVASDGTAAQCSVYTDYFTLIFDQDGTGGIEFLSDSAHGRATSNQVDGTSELFYIHYDGSETRSTSGSFAIIDTSEVLAQLRQQTTLGGLIFTTDYTVHGSGKAFVHVEAYNPGSSVSDKTLKFMIDRTATGTISATTAHATASSCPYILLSSDGASQRDILLATYDLWSTSSGYEKSATGFDNSTGSAYAGYQAASGGGNGFALNAGQIQTWDFMLDFAHEYWDDTIGVGRVVDDYRNPDSLELIHGTIGMEKAWENHIRGQWNFEEGAGDTAYDFSGREKHGANSGTYAYAAGNQGNYGLDLEASSRITVATDNSFDCTNEFTIMTWLKPDDYETEGG